MPIEATRADTTLDPALDSARPEAGPVLEVQNVTAGYGRATVLRFGLQDELDESFHENLLSSALRAGKWRARVCN